MFFTSVPSGDFGTPSAILVNDASDPVVPITGSTSGSTERTYTFDYTNNAQGGRTPGTDAHAPVTVVAIGFGSAQYVTTTATILETKTNNISLVAALERNYDNPA
jgi:hypothetical protein